MNRRGINPEQGGAACLFFLAKPKTYPKAFTAGILIPMTKDIRMRLLQIGLAPEQLDDPVEFFRRLDTMATVEDMHEVAEMIKPQPPITDSMSYEELCASMGLKP